MPIRRTTNMPDDSKPRLPLLDTATGLTMILVVFGHNYFDELQQDAVYGPLRYFIYQFHMSVFIFISGFIIFYSYKPVIDFHGYRRYVHKKARKFIPIYILLSILYILVDLYLNQIDFHDIPEQIAYMFLSPVRGRAIFLWYLYALMIFYILTPLLKSLPEKTLYVILAAGFLLTFYHLPYEFSVNMVGKYFFFFLLGGFFGERMGCLSLISNKFGLIGLCFFCLLLINAFTHIMRVPYQLTSIVAIICVFYISSIELIQRMPFLQDIGKHSYYIYLLNSLVIGTFYLMYQKAHLSAVLPLRFYVIILTILGIILPLRISMFENKRRLRIVE